MRILSPTGKLLEIFRVEPYVEEKHKFNGLVHETVEVVRKLAFKPTGIKFYAVPSNSEKCFSNPNVYIGNLPANKVQEILDTMLKEGTYDFSKLDYQNKLGEFMQNFTIDEGKSLPYYKEIVVGDSSVIPFNARVDIDDSDDSIEESEDFL